MIHELRDYQKDSVEALRENIRNGIRRQVLCSPTGSGKTEIAMYIVEEAARKGSRVYFVCDRQTLVEQTSERFTENDIEHGVLMGQRSRRLWSNILVCSSQTLESRGFSWKRTKWEWEDEQETARPPDLLIIDECFPGDVEILTDKGFCRFDKLDVKRKVAQWHPETEFIDFCHPTKHINKPFGFCQSDYLIRLKSDQKIDLAMTPNHQMVFRTKAGRIRKPSAESCRLNKYNNIPVAGLAKGDIRHIQNLNAHDRMMIALQADGSIHYEAKTREKKILAFSFAKQGKIERFRKLLQEGQYEHREENRKDNKVRFFVYNAPAHASKTIQDHFDLSAMDASKARAILEEMVEWDGSRVSDSMLYFSSTDETATDFYQAVAILAGYKARKTVQKDNRSETFKDCYRLFISKTTRYISAQNIKRTEEKYQGTVHCVRVPSGCIIVRSEGRVAVVGNCHEIRKKIVGYIVEKDVLTIGLSATPFTKGLKKYYDAVVNVTTTQELVTQEFLSPLRIVASHQEVDVEGLKVNYRGEWDQQQMSDRVMQITGEIIPEWEKNTKKYFGGPVPTIVFCPSVADSQEIAEKFQENGYDFRVVSYKDSAEAKQEKVNSYKRGEHLGLISCVALTKGFDAPYTQCLIDAYPLRKSFSMHIQKVGRVMRIAEGKEYGLVIDHAGNWLGFYDQTHAFFEAGCSELEPESAKKAKRKERAKTEHLRCKECGFVFSPEDDKSDTCPACGAAKKRKRGKLTVVDGVLGEVDAIDKKGRKLPFNGDWWPELCAIALKVADGDTDKAERIAYAKYKNIFGRWPGQEFVYVDREPHPKVAAYEYKQYQRYKIAQRKSAR